MSEENVEVAKSLLAAFPTGTKSGGGGCPS